MTESELTHVFESLVTRLSDLEDAVRALRGEQARAARLAEQRARSVHAFHGAPAATFLNAVVGGRCLPRVTVDGVAGSGGEGLRRALPPARAASVLFKEPLDPAALDGVRERARGLRARHDLLFVSVSTLESCELVHVSMRGRTHRTPLRWWDEYAAIALELLGGGLRTGLREPEPLVMLDHELAAAPPPHPLALARCTCGTGGELACKCA